MNPSLELLRAVLTFLEKLSPDDIMRLTEGRAELSLVPHPRAKRTGRQSPKPLSKADLTKLRDRIEKQKAGPKNQSLNWLNRYRKDCLWQLIRTYNFPPAVLNDLTSSAPKAALITFVRLKVLGLESNQSSIGRIDLDGAWS
jgi:hypothetical protein